MGSAARDGQRAGATAADVGSVVLPTLARRARARLSHAPGGSCRRSWVSGGRLRRIARATLAKRAEGGGTTAYSPRNGPTASCWTTNRMAVARCRPAAPPATPRARRHGRPLHRWNSHQRNHASSDRTLDSAARPGEGGVRPRALHAACILRHAIHPAAYASSQGAIWNATPSRVSLTLPRPRTMLALESLHLVRDTVDTVPD